MQKGFNWGEPSGKWQLRGGHKEGGHSQVHEKSKADPQEPAAKNKVQTINTYVLPVIKYHTGTVTWPQEEMEATDVKTRKLLKLYRGFEPKGGRLGITEHQSHHPEWKGKDREIHPEDALQLWNAKSEEIQWGSRREGSGTVMDRELKKWLMRSPTRG